MLNNWAFAFNISVPVHIILRSFGSVTTMIAGWLRGKKYTPVQIFSVALLTIGVMVSAWADAASKVFVRYLVERIRLTDTGQNHGYL
jgi:dolichyl-phosphate-mannose-protein mannosyltransferase